MTVECVLAALQIIDASHVAVIPRWQGRLRDVGAAGSLGKELAESGLGGGAAATRGDDVACHAKLARRGGERTGRHVHRILQGCPQGCNTSARAGGCWQPR